MVLNFMEVLRIFHCYNMKYQQSVSLSNKNSRKRIHCNFKKENGVSRVLQSYNRIDWN